MPLLSPVRPTSPPKKKQLADISNTQPTQKCISRYPAVTGNMSVEEFSKCRGGPDLVKVSIRLGKKITDDMVIKRTSETHQTRRIPPEIRDMSTQQHHPRAVLSIRPFCCEMHAHIENTHKAPIALTLNEYRFCSADFERISTLFR